MSTYHNIEFTSTPYRSEKVDQLVAELFKKQNVKTSAHPDAFKKITLVGGIVDIHDKLFFDDQATLLGVATLLTDAGIKISDKPEISLYNIVAPMKSDFTLVQDEAGQEHEADIIILSALPLHGVDYRQVSQLNIPYTNAATQAYRDMAYTHDRVKAVNLNHKIEGIWEESAKSTGAPFVFVRGGLQDEISITHVTGSRHFDHYVPVIRTYEAPNLNYICPGFMHRPPRIAGGRAFAVERTFLQQIAPHVVQESLLGERIVEAAKKYAPASPTLIPTFA